MYPGTIAAQHPDRPAVIMGGSGEVVTFRELDERSNRLAHLLRAAGLRRGDTLAVLLENHPRFLEVAWAGLRSGLYVTAINSHLTAEEVTYIVGDCGARALVTSAALAPVAGELAWSGLDAVGVRLVIGGELDGFAGYEAAVAAFPASPVADESSGATMLYSSGTTGRPKGVLKALPEAMPWDEDPAIAAAGAAYGFRDGMVYLSPAPMYHAAPLAFSVLAQRYGGTVVVMERFDPAAALALIERHRVTHSQWVPTMFVRLLRLPEAERRAHDLSSLELAIHAAAPCPVPVKRQMIDWWGPVLYEYYAGTEANGSTAITSDEWLAHPGSVGRARASTVHIIDPDGTELPPGEEGAIYFSGGASFEYRGDPDKTAGARLPGGLSTLGDIGYLDPDGWLYLTDRKAHMIISGGVNIYPREIEDVLIQHPAVADVAVIGLPDDEFGEAVKAVVELLDGHEGSPALAGELTAFARQHLAGFKVPRSVDFTEQLPRLPTGKLYKRHLKDQYLAAAASRDAATGT